MQVDDGHRHGWRGIERPKLLHLCVEGEVQQRLAVRPRHVARQQQPRQAGHSPRLVDHHVQPFGARVGGARVRDRNRPRAVTRQCFWCHVLVRSLKQKQLQHPGRRRGRRRRGGRGGSGRRGRRRGEHRGDGHLDVVDQIGAGELAHPEGDDDRVALAVGGDGQVHLVHVPVGGQGHLDLLERDEVVVGVVEDYLEGARR
mmetsp:Transcript_35907/g.114395  ORF Transcript_35907/g.114395 Transcript_35907/m.114395 type:complete len:200 (+) Transcript_35907:1810-2409(+)